MAVRTMLNNYQKSYKELLKKQKELVKSCGANNCINFNWDLDINNSCWKEDDKFCICKLLEGKECKEFNN